MNNMRTFRCDDDTWRKFKLVCTIENISMQNKLGELVIDYVKNRQVQLGKDTWTDSDYAEKNHSLDGNPERYPTQDPEDYAREHNQINQTIADAKNSNISGHTDL